MIDFESVKYHWDKTLEYRDIAKLHQPTKIAEPGFK